MLETSPKDVVAMAVVATAYVVAAVIMSGCTNTQTRQGCITRCGMHLNKENYAGTCSTVSDSESVILDAFDSLKDKDPRFAKDVACKALEGLELYGRKEYVWSIPPSGPLVLGVTYCESKVTEFGENPRGILHTSLAHELAHVIQNCDSRLPAGRGDTDDGHGGWTAIGLNKILDSFEQ